MAKATQYQYDIFLSHNHNDAEWVENLAARLEQERWGRRKLRAFYSPWDIGPGQRFPEEIEKALSKSRKVGLIMSPNAMKSGWVNLERIISTYIGITEREERLIPLYRRKCKIPTLLKTVIYIDFREDDKFEESYQSLIAAIKGQKLPRIPRETSAVTVSPSPAPTPPSAGRTGKATEQVKSDLQTLRQLEKDGLITEGISVEYQHKILEKFFKISPRKTK